MKQDKTYGGWRQESKATVSTVLKKLPPGWNARRNPAGNENYDQTKKKFSLDSFLSLQIKVIVDNQPLRIGEGCLPEWLQRKKGLCALDTFSYNLCVFRCLAVHLGNGPVVRSGPRHRDHGTTAHSLNCLSFYPRHSCLWGGRPRSLCSSWSFFPRGRGGRKIPPAL